MSDQSNIKKILAIGSSNVFNIVISLARTKVTAHYIGAKGIGIIGQLGSLVALQDFLTSIVVNNGIVSHYSNCKTVEERYKIYKSVLPVIVVLGLILSTVTALFREFLSLYFFNTIEYSHFFLIVAICAPLNAIGFLININLIYSQELKKIVYRSFISSFLITLATLGLVLAYGLEGAVASILIVSVVNTLLIFTVFRNSKARQLILPDQHSFKEFLNVDFSFLKTIIKLGFVLSFSSILFQYLQIEIKNLITESKGLEVMGYFQAISNLSKQYLPVISNAIPILFASKFSLVSFEKKRQLAYEYNKGYNSILIISFLAFLLLITLSDVILHLVYKKDFAFYGIPFSLFVINDFLRLASRFMMQLLISQYQIFWMILSDLLIAGIIYLFVFLLIPKLGLNGVILGMQAGSFVNVLIIFHIIRTKLKISFSLKRILLFFVCLLALYLAVFLKSKDFIWISIGYAIVTGGIFVTFALSPTDKRKIVSKLKFKFKRNA